MCMCFINVCNRVQKVFLDIVSHYANKFLQALQLLTLLPQLLSKADLLVSCVCVSKMNMINELISHHKVRAYDEQFNSHQ